MASQLFIYQTGQLEWPISPQVHNYKKMEVNPHCWVRGDCTNVAQRVGITSATRRRCRTYNAVSDAARPQLHNGRPAPGSQRRDATRSFRMNYQWYCRDLLRFLLLPIHFQHSLRYCACLLSLWYDVSFFFLCVVQTHVQVKIATPLCGNLFIWPLVKVTSFLCEQFSTWFL